MKNLLMISQNYYPEIGSAANRLKNIKKLLSEHQYNVTVLTTEPSYPNRNIYKDRSFWSDDQLEDNVIRIKTKVRKYMRNMLNRLLLYLEVTVRFIIMVFKLEKNFDYIFVSSPPIFMGIVGLIAKKRFNKPLILDIRDLWPESLLGVGVFTFKPLLQVAYFIERKIYESADKIIINSESFKPYLEKKGVSSEIIHFIPNSLTEDELEYKEYKNKSQDKITILYTGNMGLAQDMNTLVHVAEKLSHREDIVFKIIGYGYNRVSIEELIQSKNLDNIKIYKPKSRQDTLTEISQADVTYVTLVDKDVFETVLPGKLIDYMCMRKPIVGDVTGYSSKVIKKAKCGFVSTNKNIMELCHYIERLANDSDLRKDLGANGHKYAMEKLRWKTNVIKLTRLLEEYDEQESLHVCLESLHK